MPQLEVIVYECMKAIFEAIIADGEADELWNEIELRVRNAINMAIVDKCEATGSYAKEKPDANQD